MHSDPIACRRLAVRLFYFAAILAFSELTFPASAQTDPGEKYFASKNSLGILAAYSNDSSHILLGDAENRKLLNIGVSYSRRLILNRIVNWQYDGELLPVALESDPVLTVAYTEVLTNPPTTFAGSYEVFSTSPCHPGSGTGSLPDGEGTVTFAYTCTRRWTIGESVSPVGFQWNFRPLHKLQPIAEGHGGYMYSTQQIPVPDAGAFNFTFDIGAGFELFQSKTRSVRAEYRYHHISNHNTANLNPGIDNGLFQVTYCLRLGR